MRPDTGAFSTCSEGYLHPIGARELCFSLVFAVFVFVFFFFSPDRLLSANYETSGIPV